MRKEKEQQRVSPSGRDWEAEQVNGRHGKPRPGAGEGRNGEFPESQEAVLHGVAKSTLLRLPGIESKTGRSPGDLCEDGTDT